MPNFDDVEIAAMLHPYFIKQGVSSSSYGSLGIFSNYYLNHYDECSHRIGYSTEKTLGAITLTDHRDHFNLRDEKIGHTEERFGCWYHYDRHGNELCHSQKKHGCWYHYGKRNEEIGVSEEHFRSWTHKMGPHAPFNCKGSDSSSSEECIP